jgi:hypothetical protein
LPSAPANGIFFSATWYTTGRSRTTRCVTFEHTQHCEGRGTVSVMPP